MESPTYIALSRQLVLSRQMDIVANNMANAATPAFKGEEMLFVEYLVQADINGEPTFAGPDGAVAYVQDLAVVRDTSEGPMTPTGGPLDLAIHGEGHFVVDTPQGPRYTRLGRFQLDAEGKLVTSEGHAVRGAGGAIFIPAEDGEVVVASDGTVSTEGGPIDRLSVVRFADEQELRKVSGGLYKSDATPLPNLEPEIAQGMVEESNVRPVVELTLLMSVMRNFQAAQRMIETQDELQRRVINTIVSSA